MKHPVNRRLRLFTIHGKELDRVSYFIDEKTCVWRRLREGRKVFWSECPTHVGAGGYVMLTLSAGSFRRSVYLHRIILEFIKGQLPQKGMDCRHLDGDRLNNHPDNLCWGTRKENSQDKIRHGTSRLSQMTKRKIGDANRGRVHTPVMRLKMTEGKRRKRLERDEIHDSRYAEMVKWRKEGRSFEWIGNTLGVSRQTVQRRLEQDGVIGKTHRQTLEEIK